MKIGETMPQIWRSHVVKGHCLWGPDGSRFKSYLYAQAESPWTSHLRFLSLNFNDYHQKSPQTTNVGEGVERKELSYTVAGNVNWLVQPLWRTIWRFPKKTKNRATIWPCSDPPGHISGEKHDLKGYMHPSVHCSTVYNSQDMEAT